MAKNPAREVTYRQRITNSIAGWERLLLFIAGLLLGYALGLPV